jgi:hypothetical protein
MQVLELHSPEHSSTVAKHPAGRVGVGVFTDVGMAVGWD